MNIEIIEETSEYFVIYKPAGFASQSANAFTKDVVSELSGYLAEKTGKMPYLGLVHRLDQPVEGLLVIAKNKSAAANLSEQLTHANKTCQKEYQAVLAVSDNRELAIGKKETLTDYLKKDARNSRAEIATEKDGKKAVLSYELIARKEQLALVRIQLETGRFHQIRAQFANAGMSLLGDQKYASELSKNLSAENQVKNVALCASKLSFLDPKTKKQMQYEIKPRNDIFQCFITE